ncbi:MAG: Septum site-determining protein DivIVA [Candidatus Aminicenantes bacterium ADurb.Bin508]|nr:MAG: Septum site-determining protein DivIVA [Candidatus Aminicenantes bacterium ADurb.Bin508]HNX42009.1 DivIVA domain-containing protein [Candidatus Aminicenantes bacterium]HPB54999.1 DivIVA domain-containing protein [Candidatus Aminicenantes bacterium]HPT00206.1 DivIVA domain-containing protein [Candidatus Aminicenantes bacterium]
MALTPNDIQKQSFAAKRWGGVDGEEVRSFLIYVAEQFDMALRERARLEEELLRAKEKVDDLVGREELLKRTILSTQRWADDFKERAEREASLILREAEAKADEIIRGAYEKQRRVESSIQDLKEQQSEALQDLEGLIRRLQRFQEQLQGERERESNLRPLLSQG